MRRNSRQRGRLRWTAVAAAVAAGVLTVTGCGQTRLGAAALYDNQRISTADLTAQVSNLNAGYQADKSKLQIRYTTADMPRQVLSWLLRFATTEQLARRTGIKARSRRSAPDDRRAAGPAGQGQSCAVPGGQEPAHSGQPAVRCLRLRPSRRRASAQQAGGGPRGGEEKVHPRTAADPQMLTRCAGRTLP